MIKKIATSILLPVLLAVGAVRADAEDEDLARARRALITFYEYLGKGSYEDAASLFSPPSLISTTDLANLLKTKCSDALSHCHCVPILKIVEESAVSAEEFSFTVQFRNPDGSIYHSVDRSFDPQRGEYFTTEFDVHVLKQGQNYRVREIPECQL